ncbi:MAG: aldehyde dehydrogenase [Bacteroidota bacterium]|nr:aldehyde dehydrogenase [Bacteroidota bacterium]
MQAILQQLTAMRSYYESGATQSYLFRKEKLESLRHALLRYEKEIMLALQTDLKKNQEETWVTEIGFVLAEITHTLKHFRHWMQQDKVSTNFLNFPGKSYVYKEPLGVVLIIGPWNYPLQLLLTPLVGAIAAGNCAVVKPSEFAPATMEIMKRIIEETFAANYIFYAEGDGAVVVPLMMNSFRFDHVFYTGSTGVGKLIYQMAAKQLTPVTLELGGKSPCVVESDADINVAAKRIAMTKFSNAGQMCVAPDYVLVHQAVKESFIAALKGSINKFFSAEPSSSYNYGKIINEKAFNRLVSYLPQGKIIYGGRYDVEALYIEPTLLEDTPMDAPIMNEEIFGPILPIIPFETFEEAKAIINRNPNPLAFYVFTNSREKEAQWLSQISFGGGCVNNASWHLTNFNLPFGGRGNSGIGAYHGKYSFILFSHQKAVLKTPTWFDPAIKYPPFKGKLKWFKKLIR